MRRARREPGPSSSRARESLARGGSGKIREMTAALSGFVLGLGLIVPIGAQNVHVLRAGLLATRWQAFVTVAVVTSADALMITLGGYGLARSIERSEPLQLALYGVGAVVVARLAVEAGTSAVRRPANPPTRLPEDEPQRRFSSSYWPTRALLVSLGNPHALIDTVAVIGGAASATAAAARPAFVSGAVLASLAWFTSLASLGAVVLRRGGPKVERGLDAFSAVVLAVVAVVLLEAGVRILLAP